MYLKHLNTELNRIKHQIKKYFLFGIIILSAFGSFAQVDIIGKQKAILNINGSRLKIPYYSSHDLDKSNTKIERAVVVVHGTDRNAATYYTDMMTAASMSGTNLNSTIIIAPQFLLEEDVNVHSLDNEHLYWSNDGWKSGSFSRNETTNPRPQRISTYAVLDTIMLRLANNLPNLKSIIFAGFSAGGQLTNRYSATTAIVDILCAKYQISTRFIVGSPSSYLYIDNKRVIEGTKNQFAIPTTSCIEYNDWKYGLGNLYNYPAIFGAETIRNRFEKREVVYLLGEKDNNPKSASLDTTCEAKLQGRERFDRGIIYFNYLKSYYGSKIVNFHSLYTVPNIDHDHYGIFTSKIGLFHLFQSPPTSCENFVTTNTIPKKTEFLVYPNPTTNYLTVTSTQNNASITIYDLNGTKLFDVNDINPPQYQLNLTSLNAGIFILEYRTENFLERKIIVKIN